MKYILFIIIPVFFITNTFCQGGNEMNLLSHWSSEAVDTQNAYVHYNEVWGVAINGNEYAIVGSVDGTHIIDINDPNNPQELFMVEGAFSNTDVIHRDYHDYKGYLYAVCDEGPSTLQIMDLNSLPDSIPVVYDSNDLIRKSHNIFIDSTSAILYHTGGNNKGTVTLYDISTPMEPVEIGFYDTFAGQFVEYAHDIFVRNDTAYMNCAEDGLVIVDFANIDSINTIALLGTDEYPESGYNHSGWITDDGNTYVMADETNGKDIKVFDLTNLPDIDLLTTLNPENPGNHIPHNPIIKGDYVYTSYYNNGLQVWNIENPAEPIKTHYFIPEENPDTWGIYPFLPSGNIIISDINSGLYILEAIDTLSTATTTKSIEQSFVNLSIYPNPAKSQITIEIPSEEGEIEIKVFDVLGNLVQSEKKKIMNGIIAINLKNNIRNGMHNILLKSIKTKYKGSFIKQ